MAEVPPRTRRTDGRHDRALRTAAVGALLAGLAFCASPALSDPPAAELTGREIIEKVNQRNHGKPASQQLRLRIVGPRKRVRERRLLSFRSFTPTASRLAFYVVSPPEMRNMAYLVFDHFDAALDDDQWVYTPQRAEPRRIASTNRREAFLGSEFSLEELKQVFRVEIDDYNWELMRSGEAAGRTFYEVVQTPKTKELAKQLGVSRMLHYIDGRHWIRMKVEYEDADGRRLRTIRVALDDPHAERPEIAVVVARNLVSGNKSEIHFRARSFERPIPDDVFTLRSLKREDIPRLERIFAD
jgi:hypothetical protein